jgi:hypothetical protein
MEQCLLASEFRVYNASFAQESILLNSITVKQQATSSSQYNTPSVSEYKELLTFVDHI